ncbi:hypothetical protein QE152_g1296 [Popillia japonica]|uniref:Uncharacterized protein n=1 Tax=Popillia japonica TaxID=7064 RepID=A0AAW1N5H5_POPJA
MGSRRFNCKVRTKFNISQRIETNRELDKWDQEDLTAKLELSLISPNELKRIENWKTSNTKINCHTDFCSCITDLLRNGAKFKGNGGDS